MLWRVRMTLPDRPGALSVLARNCGRAGVNILGLQIFPDLDSVTDELVLRCPEGWGLADIARLVERSGGRAVNGTRCTEAALVDQPSRYIQAARTVLARPSAFPEVVARLFDAEADAGESGWLDPLAVVQDVMEMQVGDVQVQVRRTAPFTATEQARAAALADLVGDVLARAGAAHLTGRATREPQVEVPADAVPVDYGIAKGIVTARVDGSIVGVATVGEADGFVVPIQLRVDEPWQGRGIGSRLLVEIGRVAAAAGFSEMMLATSIDNEAVLPMVLAAGLKGRIRLSAGELIVRIPVRDLAAAR